MTPILPRTTLFPAIPVSQAAVILSKINSAGNVHGRNPANAEALEASQALQSRAAGQNGSFFPNLAPPLEFAGEGPS